MRLILKSLILWTAAALFLLILASCALSRAGVGSEILGYVSSGISFLCAAAAGYASAGRREDKPLLQGLITALFLLILLLTVGFLAGGERMDPSGILSVASFTVTGVLFGTVLFGRKSRRKKKNRFKHS